MPSLTQLTLAPKNHKKGGRTTHPYHFCGDNRSGKEGAGAFSPPLPPPKEERTGGRQGGKRGGGGGQGRTLAHKEKGRPSQRGGECPHVVCGPTVYDFAHIGNARPVIVFDVLFRLLRHLYGPEHVTYVRNITDVDDKINARAAPRLSGPAAERGDPRVTEKTEKQFHDDVAALGACRRPSSRGRRSISPR